MRYVLTAIMPEQKDSEFTWSDFRDKVNNELADVLGTEPRAGLDPQVLRRRRAGRPGRRRPRRHRPRTAQHARGRSGKVGDLIARHFARKRSSKRRGTPRQQVPDRTGAWKLQNRPCPHRHDHYLMCQVVGNCAVLLEPFLPQTAGKIAAAFGVSDACWNDARPDLVSAGTVLGDLPILFAKIDDETVAAQVAKLGQKGDASDTSTRDIMPSRKTKSPSTTSPNSTSASAPSSNAKKSPRPTNS